MGLRMSAGIDWGDGAPPEAPPRSFPSPFDELGPHPITASFVKRLQDDLSARVLHEGKMFGVLVVRTPDGRLGALRAFSGMLDGRWLVPGFCPPLFELAARAAVEVPGERAVSALTSRVAAHEGSAEWSAARREAEAQRARHVLEREALDARHRERRDERHRRRDALRADASPQQARNLSAIDDESRRDKAERRELLARQEHERAELAATLDRHQRRARALQRLRGHVSRSLMRLLHDSYRVESFAGTRRSLRALFAPVEPPSGAGDCCAPKLLAEARRQGLEPLALAEFWWGPPPGTGGRVQGASYPACRAKCGPLLPFMLEGVEVAPPRRFEVAPVQLPGLEIVHEDEALVVIDKPEGLLSVPAKDARVEDSVLARLRARYPNASGPLIVHRLDLDTSGLLVAALDKQTHAALQRQFLRHQVTKRYVAVVEGSVTGDSGRIELPLRVDLDDRPRQIHDPVHGLRAITDWRVLKREGGTTRVELSPVTGRTHQLRVHAAHPSGLGAPIVGDRLYGHPGSRLLLHAEALRFTHPRTGLPLSFERPAPF